MGKKILVPCLNVIMIAFFRFSTRNMVFHCIFLRKKRSLLHQNTAQGSFFPLQSYPKKILRKMFGKALENTNEMCSYPLGIL